MTDIVFALVLLRRRPNEVLLHPLPLLLLIIIAAALLLSRPAAESLQLLEVSRHQAAHHVDGHSVGRHRVRRDALREVEVGEPTLKFAGREGKGDAGSVGRR